MQPRDASTAFVDYYRILDLQPGATGPMVDQAYWRCARRLGTAMSSDDSAAADLDRANEAYRVLGSPALRQEYDSARAALLAQYPSYGTQDLPAGQTPTGRSAQEGLGTIKQAVSGASSQWRATISAYPLGIAHVLGAGSVLVMLVLAIFAWAAGADPSPVGGMLILGLCMAVLLFLVPGGTAVASRAKPGRRTVRPPNLNGVSVPGGRSASLRKLVYELYEQCPHLGPAQVASVARYALFTQKVIWLERLLRERAETMGEDDVRLLIAEQRALAAELRHHESALGVVGRARALPSGLSTLRQPMDGEDEPGLAAAE